MSHLGPVLSQAHFASAQIQADDKQGAAIYCAALTDILDIDPALRNRTSDVAPGECYDVIVHVNGETVTRIDIEGTELGEMLEEHGLDEAAERVLDAYGQSAEKGATIFARVLQGLFARNK